MPAYRRSDDEATELGRPVQPEHLAMSIARHGVDEIAASSRVVGRSPETRDRPQDDERGRADDGQRQHRGDGRDQESADHRGLRAVRSAAQPNSGSAISRAAGQAAMTMPRWAGPCRVA